MGSAAVLEGGAETALELADIREIPAWEIAFRSDLEVTAEEEVLAETMDFLVFTTLTECADWLTDSWEEIDVTTDGAATVWPTNCTC